MANLPGDFNHDGTVDAAGYVVWRSTGGSPDDYGDWQTNFGRTLFPGGAARSSADLPLSTVPEPTSLLLALLAFAGEILSLKRRNSSYRLCK